MDTDLSTPQKALHALQSAYRNKDMDLAATYRDFGLEAQLVLDHLDKRAGAGPVTAEAVAQLAAALEAKWRQVGPPDLTGVTTHVTASEHYADSCYLITEEARTADGRLFSQRWFLSQGGGPWVVLCPYVAPRQQQKPWWMFWG